MNFIDKTIIKTDPFLSVVMAVHNREKYLREAIESVLNQTYENFEFFLINDGSNDNSWEIIKSYAEIDSRIVCINNHKNLGQSLARNVAIKKAQGEYVIIADSDDICLPSRFENQLKYFKEHSLEVDVLGSFFCLFTDGDINKCESVPVSISDLNDGKPPVHNPTCMIKRSIFSNNGYYDSKYDNAEDYELWSRWSSRGVRFHNLHEVLYKKRNHSGCVSTERIRHQNYLMTKINIIAIIKYHRRFTIAGYLRILEQLFYFIYLLLRLDKVYKKSGKY